MDMKDSMIKPVRIDTGLGDLPSEYKNSDPKSANFLIKHGLHFDASKPLEFIHEIKNIIETQQRNEARAAFGMGPYRVRKEFSHLTVNGVQRSRLNFIKAGMYDMKEVIHAQPESGEDPVKKVA